MRSRVVALLFLVSPGESMAQDTVVLRERITCSSCKILEEKVSTVTGVSIEGPATTIKRGESGEIYIMQDRTLRMFASNGKPIRQIGRRGGGPGEYEVVRNVLLGANGEIHLVDAQLARHSIFDAQGVFLRSRSIRVTGGIGMDAVLLSGDRLVLNTRISPRGIGFPLQVVDAKGEVATLPDTVLDSSKRWFHTRLLTVRSNGDFLAVRPYEFLLDVYSPSLKRTNRYLLPSPGVTIRPPLHEPSDGLFDIPFTPSVRGVWVDEAGLLWVMVVRPHQEWKPVRPPRAGQQLSPEARQELIERARIEIVIEVIDLKAQSVVARQVKSTYFGVPIGDGYFASTLERDDGEPVLEIRRLRLER